MNDKRRITAADIERFTRGDCHILASEIARVTGWTLCAFAYEDREPDLHAFVRCPDGTYLDIEGRWPEEALLAHWATWYGDDIRVIETTLTSICRAWRRGLDEAVYGRYSFRRARTLARYFAGIHS